MDVPIVFLDVDGPLVPFGSRTGGHPTYLPEVRLHPLLARLDPALGPLLGALPGELVWATSWMDEANDLVGPRLGLPRLPVVAWSTPSDEDGLDDCPGLHWKTRDLSVWAAGRRFVWVDDEISEADRMWVAANHPRPALLLRVEPATGLTADDVAGVGRWLSAHPPDTTDY